MERVYFNCYLYQVSRNCKETDLPIAGFLMWSDGIVMQDKLNEDYRGIRFILTEINGDKRCRNAA